MKIVYYQHGFKIVIKVNVNILFVKFWKLLDNQHRKRFKVKILNNNITYYFLLTFS